MGFFFPLMESTELCSLPVQKSGKTRENDTDKKMRDTDGLLEPQKRGQAKAYTQEFQAAGAVGGGAAPVPSNLARIGGG